MKILLLNGPPSSGKDTAAQHILACGHAYGFTRIIHEKLSLPIKRAFAGMLNISFDEVVLDCLDFAYDKDNLVPLLGKSYRQWQIDFSEKLMKPHYGSDVLARLLFDRIECNVVPTFKATTLVVVSDCGFDIEYSAIREHFGNLDTILVQLYRPGFTFADDSRDYIKARRPEGDGYYTPFYPIVSETTNELCSRIEDILKHIRIK